MKTVIEALGKCESEIIDFLVNVGYSQEEITKMFELDDNEVLAIVLAEIILKIKGEK
jgi:hypothetical protein